MNKIPNRVSEIDVSSTKTSPDGGGYNDWPKNTKKLSDEETMNAQREMLFTFAPSCTEFRQAKRKIKGQVHFLPLRILWRHDGTGLMAVRRHYFKNREFFEKILWYHVGCEHEYVELSGEECARLKIFHGGRCYHVEKCKKCGHINSYDSSD